MSNERIVGLVRPVRRLPEKRQQALLEGMCGRIWAWDERDLLLRYLRQGDVVVVCVAHCLGPTRLDVETMMTAVLAKRCSIRVLEPVPIDAETGKEAVQIAMQAVAGLSGDSRAHTADEAAKHGKKAWSKKTGSRTSFAVARKFWKSRRAREMATNEQRMAQPEMGGWTYPTFARHLKKHENG